jgi:hypothetical protein
MVAQLLGAEREIKNRAKKDETMRASFTYRHGTHIVAMPWERELVKLREHRGTLRRGLRGTARGKVFVCGGFGSHFVVVIIR